MTDATVAPPKRHRTRRFLLAFLMIALLGAIIALLIRRELVARRFAAVVDRLDRTDPGWRIEDIEQARASIPDTENSAVAIDAAYAKLVQLPPGLTEILGHLDEDLTPNVRLTLEQEGDLRDALKLNSLAVPDVLAIADYPRGRHALTHSVDGFSTLLNHVDRICQVGTRVLDPLGRLAIQDGDVPRAVTAFQARINLGRSMRDEPFLISQLVRASYYRRRAIGALERLLGHASLTPDQLTTVRRELAAELADDPWPVAVRGERAMVNQVFVALNTGLVQVSFLRSFATQTMRPTVTDRARDWLRDHVGIETVQAHAAILDLTTRMVATTSLPWHERLPAVEAIDAEWATTPEPAPWVRTQQAMSLFRGLVTEQARLRCAIVAVAIEQYRVKHGDWPTSLTAIREPLPDDPFTGKPLLFKRTADGVVVYSAGSRRAESVGTTPLDLRDVLPPNVDVFFRLWDVSKRNQPPKDKP
ncbi:MAG: hypothetical protein U0746_19900 [Gemmataceae bacterium]